MTASSAAARTRDQRLDFFRGLTMFIIFVAHADINPLNNWIPAQFGFSSGAEVFVFCSGVASALAFGRIFQEHGLWLGIARVLHRMWQIYWAHQGSALLIVALTIAAHRAFPGLSVELVARIAPDPLTGLLSLTLLRCLLSSTSCRCTSSCLR